MTRGRHSATGVCLILVLICTLIPRQARAYDTSNEEPLGRHEFAALGPIGKIYSLSPFAIDGRLVFGEQRIWGNELIETPEDSSVNLHIDSAAQITLKNAARARFTTILASLYDGTKHHLLIGALNNGCIAVKLERDAVAYIESCGETFTSSSAASFVIRIQNGKPVLVIASGTVDVQISRRPPNIKGRTVRVVANRPPVQLGGAPLDKKTGQSAKASSQWSKYYDGTGSSGQIVSFTSRIVLASYQTKPQSTQTEELLPAGRVVNFRLDPKTLGTITAQGTTDSQGVVSVTFTAGKTKVTGNLVGEIVPDGSDPPGTTYEPYTRVVNVTKLPLWRTRNIVIACAAIVGTIVIVKRDKGPIKQLPPPNILP